MVKPIKKLSKTQILKIVGHGMFGLAGGALIASPFIWSSTSVQNKLPKAKLTLVETNNSATLSMKIVRYEGFLAVIKDLQVKFVNHSGKEQILSLVDNTI
jgi:hypothetical protein